MPDAIAHRTRFGAIVLLALSACSSGTVGNESSGVTGNPAAPGTGGQMSGGGSAGSGSTASGGGGGPEQQCVDIINNYRATLGLPAYQRWTDQEACASTEAESDSQSGKAHGAFGRCGENAQNECPHYGGSYETMLPQCLDLMWKEGPGTDFSTHGHYINMTNPKYTKVACGFTTTASGEIWSVQDFK
jgi:hypothetical protein